MSDSVVRATLQRLQRAADDTRTAWPVTHWVRETAPPAESIELNGGGTFSGLTFEPGRTIEIACQLNLPEHVACVPIAGEPLEMIIFSIYPMELYLNGTSVFTDSLVPVASGNALVQVLPAITPGNNGTLLAHIHVPDNQTTPWHQMTFITPGLRKRFELLDVAWAQLALADALAVSDTERQLVAEAAACVPIELVTNAEEELTTALAHMANHLAPLAERAAALHVHMIGHSHIDMNWLWRWPDTVEVIRRDFRSVLALMRDYPELTFTHSQPATYEVIRQEEPELFAQVLEHIQAGRWEPATMTWVEGDVNLAAGEALARQFLEGIRYTREVLGADPVVCLAPDTFGHAGNLPQIAAQAGARYYYHHRCNPGGFDYWPAYWWEGQDGTRILAISTLTYNGEIRARDLAEAAITAHRNGLDVSLHFHGIGDHGGGPSRHNIETLRRLQTLPLLPTARCSTLAQYAEELLARGSQLPVHRGESSTIFEGCYTTHADTKRYNRMGENLLITADTLTAVTGRTPTGDLQQAWRGVLFHQFHDILDGSAIHETYRDQGVDFEAIKGTADAAIHAALLTMTRTESPGQVAVTNSLGWNREDWVVVPGRTGEGPTRLIGSQGHHTIGQYTSEGLGFVAQVPAFSTIIYDEDRTSPDPEPRALRAELCFHPADARAKDPVADLADAPYLRIETSVFNIYLRRDSGILVSCFDRRVGRELVGYGMRRGSDYLDSARADLALNVLQFLEEYHHGMSAWHLDEVHREQSLLRGAVTEIIEHGPIRLVVEVRHQIRASTIVQRLSFYQDLARIDMHTMVDWQELGSADAGIPNLKVAFTAHLPESEAWFETPFGAVRRPCDGQEVPALRWADVGGPTYGFAVLNDGKYGYDALGTRLRLTLLRSAYDPDAASDIGRHDIRYSLVPHPRSWREAGIVQQAAEFNHHLLVHEPDLSAAVEEPLLPPLRPRVEGHDSILIAALKPAYAGRGRVIRLYESAGLHGEAVLHDLPAGTRVWEATVVEDRLRELQVNDGRLHLTFQPWQVQTLLLEEAML